MALNNYVSICQKSGMKNRTRKFFPSRKLRISRLTLIKKEKDKKENNSLINSREQFRVVISAEANMAIEAVLRRVCEGFDVGSITKSDIANFVFLNIQKFFLDSDIKTLRGIHFDEKKMLGTLLRADADLPDELKKAVETYNPAILAAYCLKLAKAFNRVYKEVSLLKEPDEDIKIQRLKLSAKTGEVIKTCMNLLGINCPERM